MQIKHLKKKKFNGQGIEGQRKSVMIIRLDLSFCLNISIVYIVFTCTLHVGLKYKYLIHLKPKKYYSCSYQYILLRKQCLLVGNYRNNIFKSSPRDSIMRINASSKCTYQLGFKPETSRYETTALPLSFCCLHA